MDLRLRALNTLIEEKLIDQEATRQRINVTEKQVADTIESIRKEQRMSKKQLEMALEGTGLTFEDYKRQVEKGLKRSRLINRVVKSKIEIKEEDLRTYYQTHLEDYMADESVRISHILLPLPANPTENQEDGILLIAEDIMRTGQGKDFAGLAHQYAKDLPGAKGGDLGYFKKGELVPALDRMAFRLRVGQVGEPIRTQEGIILIKVTDRKGGSPIPLDQIKKKVERDYQNSQTEQLYRQWIRKLRERSFIEVKL
ncbi:MAG: hypothetical protein GTN74_01550 [Proteobacteria bacterium]|nr:hypothetical protein [Pseudomonadota bacterium]NIS67796.1 hypothetical protein [Pseudomonadota bacterium]